jgi:hypothetical protein
VKVSLLSQESNKITSTKKCAGVYSNFRALFLFYVLVNLLHETMDNLNNGILVVVICGTLTLVSCGGGGDASISKNSNQNHNDSGVLNPDLSGRLIFEYNDESWLMDISSGEYSAIPNTDWVNHDNYYGTTNDFWMDMGPSNGIEFTVTTMDDCDTEDTTYATCVTIQDLNGNYLANTRFLGRIKSPAKLSLDNQYFAIITENIYSHVEELQIYSRSGQLIANSDVSATGFDWMNDNSIVYTKDREIVFTHELSLSSDYGLRLKDEVEGTLGSVEVSPAGDQLAFTIITSGTLVSTHATPWLVNTDGSGFRQLAVSESDNPPPSITSPKWSPDGKWILLKEGAYTGGGPLNPGNNGYAYIVPTQDMNKTFILSINDDERSPEAYLLNRYDRIDSHTTSDVVNEHFNASVSWIN